MNPASTLKTILTSGQVRLLVDIFEAHHGFVPGFELTAEGFSISELENAGFIFRTRNHLEGGCYLIGEELERAVKHLPALAEEPRVADSNRASVPLPARGVLITQSVLP